jgi:hypothetical protein
MARLSTVRLHMEACPPSHCSSLACSLSSRDVEEDTRRRLPRDDNGGVWGPARKGRCIADCKPLYTQDEVTVTVFSFSHDNIMGIKTVNQDLADTTGLFLPSHTHTHTHDWRN